MTFAMPSNPAVLDVNFDGFADVVYVGDLGGQMWKWDIHAVGEDTDADALVDNWAAGVIFRTDPEVLDSGDIRYRSFFYPPAAAFDKGKLTLAFGSGEREELRYAGDPDEDDNNRFFVVHDLFPIGTHAFDTLITESDLTDATLTATDQNPLDSGYYFTVTDGEKFVTDVTIFAGFVIVASYDPEASGDGDECEAAGGRAFLYVFDTGTGEGQFADSATPADPPQDRRMDVGSGLPSNPRVSMAPDPDDDRIFIKTSTGQLIPIDPDVRDDPPSSSIYWRQIY
jgi:type IV pilus assembly protein PilY1